MTLTAAALRGSIDGVAWSLLHFLWQGALIAGLLELGLLAMRRRSAQARYLVRCVGLLAMALAPPLTFVLLRASGAHAVSAGSLSAGGEPSLWHRILDGSLSTWLGCCRWLSCDRAAERRKGGIAGATKKRPGAALGAPRRFQQQMRTRKGRAISVFLPPSMTTGKHEHTDAKTEQ